MQAAAQIALHHPPAADLLRISMAPSLLSTVFSSLALLSFPYFSLSVSGSYYNPGAAGFVSTRGTQFLVDGRPFYVNGFNAYYLSYVSVDYSSRSMISQILQRAAATGLTVGRTWAFRDGGYRALQTSPGVYDETVFQSLDFVLHEAQRNGLRLILSLCDNYVNMGGKQQYVQWGRNAGLSLSSDDAFFSDPTVKGYYKNFVKTVLTRVNTITGVAYKDDPTVFAWELMNEPRCLSDPSGDTLYAWIEEVAAYVKSVDSNHLLEAGLEGFYGPSSPEKQIVNPSGMNLQTGTDFIRFSQITGIDFATVHSYPDIWLAYESFDEQLAFLKSWVSSHIDDGYTLRKPVLFAEFGLSSGLSDFSEYNRNTFLATMYSTIYNSASQGGPASGALFWQLCPEELRSSICDGYAVVLPQDSSTANVIATQSQRLSALNQMNRRRLRLM